MTPELLAPAGQPDSGYAALHYGADAVYLGLSRFSARAEAVNFTPSELAEFTAYAHSLTPRRRVYLTLNTVVKQTELAAATETLLTAAGCGVDAVIVQDLGVAALVREHFPGLALHASTQMAIHNLAGAQAAKQLGFQRVTLARELTLEEVHRIAGEAGVEVETFIHGTLCYSYSGLCLFSSMVCGRSGNRGRCVYSCREAADTPAGRAHPFSLKDLALCERVLDLTRAGVASLKIEGRKKSPLYVAATVDYYRRLLDGAISSREARKTEARLKTIFARPWTRLFIDGKRNPDAADPEVVGHRGSRIGEVERVAHTPDGIGIVFTPHLPVERHDGLQIDIPGEARPYGFPVDHLYSVTGERMASAFAIEAGRTVAVTLPEDAPTLTPGLPLYLSSSQAVKRSYPFSKPRPGAFGIRLPASFDISLRRDENDPERCDITCAAAMEIPAHLRAIDGDLDRGPHFETTQTAWASAARDTAGAENAARTAFQRLGDSEFALANWRFDNPDDLYVRPGDWNRLRRAVLDGLSAAYDRLQERARSELAHLTTGVSTGSTRGSVRNGRESGFSWSICVDHPDNLSAFSANDFAGMREIAIGLADSGDAGWLQDMERVAALAGKEKIRLLLPLISRDNDRLEERIAARITSGWRRWLVPGLGGWHALSPYAGLDVAADWPLYALNFGTIALLRRLGFGYCTLSPEDDAGNMRDLLAVFADDLEVVVYSDIPLFIAAACAHGHIRRCRRNGKLPEPTCPENGRAMPIRMEHGGNVEIRPTACGSVVTGTPFSLCGRLDSLNAMGAKNLRVDLRWRRRSPDEAVEIWHMARQGKIRGSTIANFDRGLM